MSCSEDGKNCEEDSSDDSDGSEEGKWVGVAIGALALLIIIVWFIRTCTNKQRRRRALNKCGCKEKDVDDPLTDPESGRSQGQNGAENGMSQVYYTPQSPLTYDQLGKPVVANGKVPASSSPTVTKKEEGASSPSTKHPHTLGLKKSRSTLSMLSISLAPIVEDASEVRPQPLNTESEMAKAPTPMRSQSHPANLQLLAPSLHTHENNGSENLEEPWNYRARLASLVLRVEGDDDQEKDGKSGDESNNNALNFLSLVKQHREGDNGDQNNKSNDEDGKDDQDDVKGLSVAGNEETNKDISEKTSL